jgi:hypothetical protein
VSENQLAQMRSRSVPEGESLLLVGVDVQALAGPPHGGIADINGGLWLSADLLTDCMEGKDTYNAIAPILATLPITLLLPKRFPTPDAD